MTKAPFGSPAAGPVRVLTVDFDGTITVRVEEPWDSDLEPGTTLPSGPGRSWVRKAEERPDEEDDLPS